MIRVRAFAVAAAIATGVAFTSPSLPSQHALPPERWAAFVQLLDERAAADSVVGAAAVLVHDGRIVAHHEYGFADRARGQRVSERTIFHYGSITKTLTAIAIMQLRDRGRLSLDDPVTRYIPELRRVHDPYGSMDSITIRMLLSHSAGFQNPTWPYKLGKPWEPFEPTSWNQLVAMMPYQELLFQPGSRFSYSNPGFVYLARIIEELTDDPWEGYVQKNILSPLGLTRSSFGASPYYLAADRSANYTLVRDSAAGGRERLVDNGREFDPGITIPNSGWNAPLADLATWVGFLTGATHGDSATRRLFDTVLHRSSLEEMWQPTHATAEPDESMGMSFFIERRRGGRLVGHTGSQAGFLSLLFFDPVSTWAVIAVVNTADEAREDEARQAFPAIREAALALIGQ